MWWDTWTDPDCSILLSCAPSWAHHNLAMGAELPWRDHWMQAIYYPRTHTTAVKVATSMRAPHLHNIKEPVQMFSFTDELIN